LHIFLPLFSIHRNETVTIEC